MTRSEETTGNLTELLEKANAGADAGADDCYSEVINRFSDRLMRLTRTMMKDYSRLRRWEQSDDIFQSAVLRLHRSLPKVRPASTRDFLGLASTQIRRTLLDLARHYYGPEGKGTFHHTDNVRPDAQVPSAVAGAADQRSPKPETLQEWTEFHEAVENLEEEQREVFHLIWYAGLEQAEVARVIGCSLPTVQRRWYAAQIALFRILREKPGADRDGALS